MLGDATGGTMYWDLERIVCEVALTLPGVKIGIHTHNDSELGVANTLAGVRGGASFGQGTINGYGEPCGNPNLCSILPDLAIKIGLRTVPDTNPKPLTRIPRT